MYGRMGSTATVQRQAARRSMVGWRATAACHRLAADYGGVAGPRGGALLLVQLWSAGHESGGALHGDLHLDVTCAPLGRVRGRGRGIGVG